MLVRRTTESEDLVALTAMIRAAYAPHALKGLRYWATHQSVEDTARRLGGGVGFVGEVDGELVATITLSKPDPESKVALLRDEFTWSFGQFAVAPTHKGKGYGRRIHDAALQHAIREGCQVMALHTAEPAVELIEMYRSWGYAQVGTCDWRPHTNFLSVLMTKSLASQASSKAA
ncbi:GNAT family N-acetyltransferase [Caenimonas koreensis]|uniref:GNAT family N-acetyltransferase n=2 Tax=Caenimonas TaxID=763439 RepID=A0A844AVY8_9BURK|nr:GNAT family N-acetyltransferase [Caenimonas koreensis DSM 17982]